MDKQEIFAQIEAMEEQMGNMYADLSRLKATVVELLEENQRLAIENGQLRRLIRHDGRPDFAGDETTGTSEQGETPAAGIGAPAAMTREGYDNLARLYHEGFHICNVYYGHLRTEGDCLFCLSFLNK